MQNQSRRGLLRKAIKTAFAAAGAAIIPEKAFASTTKADRQNSSHLEKTLPPGITPPSVPLPISNVVAYGNLLFFSSTGDHAPGSIEDHTTFAINELEKNLIAAGSSLQKVLRVGVYLRNIEDYDRMNVVYKARNWGPIAPARTVIAPAGIPFDPLFEIDCVAYI